MIARDSSLNSPSPTPIYCLLVDADPDHRWELGFYLQQTKQWQVIAEAETAVAATARLSALLPTAQRVQMVLLGLSDLGDRMGVNLTLVTQLRSIDPQVIVILLANPWDASNVSACQAAWQGGRMSVCVWDIAPEQLTTVMEQAIRGNFLWELSGSSPGNRNGELQALPATSSSGQTNRSQPVAVKPSLVVLKSSRSGNPSSSQSPQTNPSADHRLQPIDLALAQIAQHLRQPRLSRIDRWILEGRQRELRSARWLAQKILGAMTPDPSALPPAAVGKASTSLGEPSPRQPIARNAALSNTLQASSGALVDPPLLPAPLSPSQFQAQVFDRLAAKLQTSLENLTEVPLEIDILREDKKRELLYLVLQQLEASLEELRFSQVQAGQLALQPDAWLLDIWESTLTQFVGKYYTLATRDRPSNTPSRTRSAEPDSTQTTPAVEVVPQLLQARNLVAREILHPLPLLETAIAHLLFQTPLRIDNELVPFGSDLACDRVIAILEHAMLQMGNAVLQPLINQFGDWEPIKQTFYSRRHLSSREIARFRNELSWKYRRDRYLEEPTAIFESQHRLWTVTTKGIRRTSIYAPRREELEALAGIPYMVTLALETRDAIAPRMQAAIAFVGSGVVYLLTEVIGRGLGLIGQGIAKGIGNTWQGKR
ncbi:MAG: DUF3685 domain-containing protein [Synechococcales bacterium]|nr:DUF3685 domain-containing protein [Synechococcales bacterium]